MTHPPCSLVVGIGSAHGDDQAGWRLIDTLKSRDHAAAQLRKASVPHDMIDWMDACEWLHVVDACDSLDAVRQLDLPSGQIASQAETRSSNSHQIGVSGVIELAASLGRLPERVTLWAIPAKNFHANSEIGDACMKHVELCADLIQRELDHA
jgi:hydrogenase maturation protease